ncbi:TPA: DUF2591 domain-containing protein [Pseudomonas aeruginosa]|nr:DUF2591 domain-containing protein [Pseudomonas aeruginosa]
MNETVEVKTCDLEGPALDWAVAIADNEKGLNVVPGWRMVALHNALYAPSRDWSQGGPLIEKYMVRTHYMADTEKRADAGCIAQTWRPYATSCGDTLLIAACRAIVTASLGETVSVPAELIK